VVTKIKQEIKKFTGGSLSSTTLHKDGEGKYFVRKSVSLKEHREYGFQRWYSQLKKIQRLNHMFPHLFPEILCFGVDNNHAFFDMPYYKDMMNAYTFVKKADPEQIDTFFYYLIKNMNKLYSISFLSVSNAIHLYLKEEIEQKIKEATKNNSFKKFLKYKTIIFNDSEIPSFISQLDNYKHRFKQYYREDTETYTHGNITLENILYNPKNQRILFIDLYEENIVDTPLAEYSQLLQSSNSKYELYNDKTPTINKNKVTCNISYNHGLDYFNKILINYLNRTYSKDQIICIKLFEVSQFIRMLAFKSKFNTKKTIFFYSLASYLLDVINNE
jgi:hypothetical protein